MELFRFHLNIYLFSQIFFYSPFVCFNKSHFSLVFFLFILCPSAAYYLYFAQAVIHFLSVFGISVFFSSSSFLIGIDFIMCNKNRQKGGKNNNNDKTEEEEEEEQQEKK